MGWKIKLSKINIHKKSSDVKKNFQIVSTVTSFKYIVKNYVIFISFSGHCMNMENRIKNNNDMHCLFPNFSYCLKDILFPAASHQILYWHILLWKNSFAITNISAFSFYMNAIFLVLDISFSYKIYNLRIYDYTKWYFQKQNYCR